MPHAVHRCPPAGQPVVGAIRKQRVVAEAAIERVEEPAIAVNLVVAVGTDVVERRSVRNERERVGAEIGIAVNELRGGDIERADLLGLDEPGRVGHHGEIVVVENWIDAGAAAKFRKRVNKPEPVTDLMGPSPKICPE